jgi:hypothetical protein
VNELLGLSVFACLSLAWFGKSIYRWIISHRSTLLVDTREFHVRF